jgi:hypothetical protein
MMEEYLRDLFSDLRHHSMAELKNDILSSKILVPVGPKSGL